MALDVYEQQNIYSFFSSSTNKTQNLLHGHVRNIHTM